MNHIATVALALVLLGSAAAPAVAQPGYSQTTTHVRVFEGPN